MPSSRCLPGGRRSHATRPACAAVLASLPRCAEGTLVILHAMAIRTAGQQPEPPPGVAPIGSLTGPGKATVEGRIFAVEIRPVDGSNVLATEIADSTGELTALFYGRPYIPGMDCGGRVRFRGRVSFHDGQPVMINPAYELIGPDGPDRPAPRRGRGNGGQRRNHRRMPGDQT